MTAVASAAYLGTVWFAFAAGVGTFFAPCAYPLLPGYVSYYVQAVDDSDRPPVRGAFLRGLAAAVGALCVFVALTAVVYVSGQTVVGHIEVIDPVVGVALVTAGGATLLGWMPDVRVTFPVRRSSVSGFLAFGAGYAAAAAGCVLPVLTAVVLQSLRFDPARAASVLGAYAAGVCGLLLAVTVLSALGSGLPLPARASRLSAYTSEIAGVVMLFSGVWQVYRSVVVFHML